VNSHPIAFAKQRGIPAEWMSEGDIFKAFLLAYGVFRFFVEFDCASLEICL